MEAAARSLQDCSEVLHGLTHLRVEIILCHLKIQSEGRYSGDK
jgi:hypothetical protein